MGEPELDFSWDVELPDRRAGGLGGSRPRATVLLDGESGHEEWRVPVAVGRALTKAKKGGEANPGSRAELAYLLREASLNAGKRRVEALLNKRDYSTKELTQKLQHDGYGASSAEALVAWAEEAGYVRDSRFADVFIRTKVGAGWGRARIERELALKGIDASAVPGWPEDYLSEDDERDRALELASRRRLTGKNDFQKIVRFLCTRGYGMSLAVDVAREVLSQTETDV